VTPPALEEHARAGDIWKAVGARKDKLFPDFPATMVAATPGSLSAVWYHAGGIGAPPRALEAVAKHTKEPFHAVLVGDLPEPTETLFLVSVLFRAILVDGVGCLVVVEGSEVKDALVKAVDASGAWRCGPIVAGEAELRQVIEGGSTPSVVILSMQELSSSGIRALASGTNGPAWARSIGLVVVPRVDRGGPLVVTHRLFILKRLTVALHAVAAQWSVLATGLGGSGSRALLEHGFPDFTVLLVPFGPKTHVHLRVYRAEQDFRRRVGKPWLARAIAPLTEHGLAASVGDPTGTFDPASLNLDPVDCRLVRDLTLDREASATELDAAWFIAAYRALRNRVPLAAERPPAHDCLWGYDDNPLINFLTSEGVLPSLEQADRVPAPRPLVGGHNKMLMASHVDAAWREGERDLTSLRGMFDPSVVDQQIRATPSEHVLRYSVRDKKLSRVPKAPPAHTDVVPVLRTTVTENVAKVIVHPGGRELGVIDWALAATHYYPQRVFTLGEHRYQVPFQAVDEKRRQVRVSLVDATQPLTEPLLDIRVEIPATTAHGQAQEVLDGILRYTLLTFDADAVEDVRGVYEPATNPPRIETYAPVSTTYPTRMRGIFFAANPSASTLRHLAIALEDVFAAHILAPRESLKVVVVAEPGLLGYLPTGLVVVDRHILGMGLADILDKVVVGDALAWLSAMLGNCTCKDGCEKCTPAAVLKGPLMGRDGPDKQGVMQLLRKV
jgi:hypothetical protein